MSSTQLSLGRAARGIFRVRVRKLGLIYFRVRVVCEQSGVVCTLKVDPPPRDDQLVAQADSRWHSYAVVTYLIITLD